MILKNTDNYMNARNWKELQKGNTILLKQKIHYQFQNHLATSKDSHHQKDMISECFYTLSLQDVSALFVVKWIRFERCRANHGFYLSYPFRFLHEQMTVNFVCDPVYSGAFRATN
ncbi:hypothetical protein AVEN_116619-1 [Araneus ventricosus]|uniref:Uncharacterized protein n=1 Tax=Araneus ventricosus TaxID=182803 RepID=A0A4Y2DDU7_ARAVE|nr:hypothetical protein AVEN_116619-1 [Araneus ventricosus]